MITATAHSILNGQTRIDQLAYDRARGALDTAIATTRKMKLDDAKHVTDDAAISQLADKPLNALVAVIKEAIAKQHVHPADPVAADEFFAAYKSKDKVDLRRSLLLIWFTKEKAATSELLAKLDAEKKKAEKKLAKQRQAVPVVTIEHTDGSATSTATPETITTVAVPAATSATPTRAKREKKPAEPKPAKAPRDRFESMNLAELLIEVQRMFGHGTEMTNESALRYKLRRGEKMRAAGQVPKFSVSTPSAPRVRFTIERAKQLRELLLILEKSGNGVAGQIVAEIDEQLAPKQQPANAQQAAA